MVTHITYRGPAFAVGALAQMLREEGVSADYAPPEERRSAGEIVEAVVVNLACTGAFEAARVAVNRFRASRFGSHSEITLFSSEDDSDQNG